MNERACEARVLETLPSPEPCARVTLIQAVSYTHLDVYKRQSLRSGVEMVLRQMCEAFEKRGITPISRKGEKFDPCLLYTSHQGTRQNRIR